jgi:predicted alternative tryptophan synthase beta-subunit
MIAAALREAVVPHVNQPATPETCHAINRAFIRIMRDRYAVNWQRHAKQIRVQFRGDGKLDILIPEELLERTLH